MRLRFVQFAFILSMTASVAFGQCPIDAFGGYTCKPSSKPSTGWFRTEKFQDRWFLVDPANNAFFMKGVFVVDAIQVADPKGRDAYKTAHAKYGTMNQWADAAMRRIKAWGFNTSAQSSWYTQPLLQQQEYQSDDGYIATKLPFTVKFPTSNYAMRNNNKLLKNPVKDFTYGINREYDTYWIPSLGEPDYYDAQLYNYLKLSMDSDPWWDSVFSAPSSNQKYLVAVSTDESDQLFSMTVGSDFTTMPPERNHANGGYRVAICSPIQAANAGYSKGFVYADTKVYIKAAWSDFLTQKYQTIEKLNQAWGSKYTTFGSNGVAHTGEAVATATGVTQEFAFKASSAGISKHSLQVFVGKDLVAGDTGDKKLFGPQQVSGTVNYKTGEIVVRFPKPPVKGHAITISYVQNGWGSGSGVLDEDGRHTTWMGTDAVYLTKASPAAKADMSAFLYEFTKHYLSNMRQVVMKKFSSVHKSWKPLFTGNDLYGGYDVPAPCEVLKAVSEEADLLVFNHSMGIPEKQVAYIQKCAGDKPIIETFFATANQDSALKGIESNASVDFKTQVKKAEAYKQSLIGSVQRTSTVVGMIFWDYYDLWNEKTNWGLVSVLDNSYDGKESSVAIHPCSPPLEKYSCGGESADYGDAISGIRDANSQIDRLLISH